MIAKAPSARTQVIAAAIIAFLSRLAFLNNGYGKDPDAWRVANAARSIASTGQYVTSRLPGYPVQELFYSIIWRLGGRSLAFNMITAIMSAVCVVMFCLYLDGLGSRDVLVGGLTLGLVPVVFVHSTDSMDYVWALAFILTGVYLVFRHRLFSGGVCIGLAIGCRITSGAILIPATVMVIDQCGKPAPRRLLALWIPAFLVGTCSFIPVMGSYGLSFFSFYEARNSILRIVGNASIGVWGTIGSFLLVLSAVALVLRRHVHEDVSVPAGKPLVIAWLAAVSLYGVAFLRLPDDGGYLIPLVPFIVLLLGRFLRRRLFLTVCFGIMLSSFVLSVTNTGIYLDGPILHDYQEREQTSALVNQVVQTDRGQAQTRVIVSGTFLPVIEASLGSDVDGSTTYVYLLSPSDLQAYRGAGYEIYYLPTVREFNLQRYGIDLNAEGGKVIALSAGN